jgi:hypothetical protein
MPRRRPRTARGPMKRRRTVCRRRSPASADQENCCRPSITAAPPQPLPLSIPPHASPSSLVPHRVQVGASGADSVVIRRVQRPTRICQQGPRIDRKRRSPSSNRSITESRSISGVVSAIVQRLVEGRWGGVEKGLGRRGSSGTAGAEGRDSGGDGGSRS